MPEATAAPPLPPGVAVVAERPTGNLLVHPGWAETMPWLVQGTTAGGDMTLFGESPAGEVVGRWLRLREGSGALTIVHARQVHSAVVRTHAAAPPGLWLAPDCDGHATRLAGVLLAVSIADCVPVSVVAPGAGAIALLHAGWRGAAAGILERGMEVLQAAFGAAAADLLLHLGPAICGPCYEVGAEVLAAFDVQAHAPLPNRGYLDLRAVLAARALRAGVPAAGVTVSAHCTRCGDVPLYSHRAGQRERQIAVLGIRRSGAVDA